MSTAIGLAVILTGIVLLLAYRLKRRDIQAWRDRRRCEAMWRVIEPQLSKSDQEPR